MMDKDYLYQIDIREWIERGLDADIMVPVSGNKIDKKYDIYLQSFLLPLNEVENDMENDTYNAHTLMPGITVYGSWEDDEKVYHRWGNDNGYEPLVIKREYNGVATDSIEIVEEFRLLFNLYFNSQKNEYIDVSNGEGITVVKMNDNGYVTIHKRYLKTYLAVKEKVLMIHIDSRCVSIDNSEKIKEDGLVYRNSENTIFYALNIGNTSTGLKRKNYSIIYAKNVVSGCSLCDSNIWPYNEEKTLINNIYHMLSYAFQALNQETYEDVAVESFDEMYNLLAAILSKGIGLQLKQGLYREYISRQEELSVMRGKINMPGTIKNRLAHKRVLTCDFDELSENNLLNQILKTTVTLLLRNGKVQAKYKDDLKKKMLYFSNVEIIEPTGIKWSSIRFQRNNQTYRMLVSICQLIIEGMLITTDSGDYRLASFVDEQRMCRLYEKFILEYYSRHYPELSVSASQIPWSLDDGIGTMLPVMQSDIHLQRGNTVLIIDAKYYSHTTQSQFDKHTIHSNNLYQIFTYVKNRSYQFGEEKNTVSGMLLYAKTEEEIQPDNVYQMHGSQISVKTLDLNQPFAEIANQMDRIVESHFSGLAKKY